MDENPYEAPQEPSDLQNDSGRGAIWNYVFQAILAIMLIAWLYNLLMPG